MQEGELVERRIRAQRVARRLFQNEDNTQNQNKNQDLGKNDEENLANQMAEEAKRKWNFDFVNEKPLPGIWEWEKVEPSGWIKNDNENSEATTK